MCITFFYLGQDAAKDKYKLVLIMNRDEFFKRPTSKAEWQDGILAGRDQEPGKEGGTWLGMNDQGFLALLTNIYAGKSSPGAGRGFLVIDALKEEDNENYLKKISESDTRYSPFNLLLLEPKSGTYQAKYYCRGLEGCVISDSYGPVDLEAGFHGLSNHPKTCPYQKTIYGTENLKNILNANVDNEKELIEKLFSMMSDGSSHYPDAQMMKQAGDDSPMEPFHPKLACINVNISERGYGTRVTTLVLVDQDNDVTFVEKSLQSNEEKIHKFKF